MCGQEARADGCALPGGVGGEAQDGDVTPEDLPAQGSVRPKPHLLQVVPYSSLGK